MIIDSNKDNLIKGDKTIREDKIVTGLGIKDIQITTVDTITEVTTQIEATAITTTIIMEATIIITAMALTIIVEKITTRIKVRKGGKTTNLGIETSTKVETEIKSCLASLD